jgi:hypothetical protein
MRYFPIILTACTPFQTGSLTLQQSAAKVKSLTMIDIRNISSAQDITGHCWTWPRGW